ncbi:MAG: hypothetical protein V1855_03635, partial [bacterium]
MKKLIRGLFIVIGLLCVSTNYTHGMVGSSAQPQRKSGGFLSGLSQTITSTVGKVTAGAKETINKLTDFVKIATPQFIAAVKTNIQQFPLRITEVLYNKDPQTVDDILNGKIKDYDINFAPMISIPINVPITRTPAEEQALMQQQLQQQQLQQRQQYQTGYGQQPLQQQQAPYPQQQYAQQPMQQQYPQQQYQTGYGQQPLQQQQAPYPQQQYAQQPMQQQYPQQQYQGQQPLQQQAPYPQQQYAQQPMQQQPLIPTAKMLLIQFPLGLGFDIKDNIYGKAVFHPTPVELVVAMAAAVLPGSQGIAQLISGVGNKLVGGLIEDALKNAGDLGKKIQDFLTIKPEFVFGLNAIMIVTSEGRQFLLEKAKKDITSWWFKKFRPGMTPGQAPLGATPQPSVTPESTMTGQVPLGIPQEQLTANNLGDISIKNIFKRYYIAMDISERFKPERFKNISMEEGQKARLQNQEWLRSVHGANLEFVNVWQLPQQIDPAKIYVYMGDQTAPADRDPRIVFAKDPLVATLEMTMNVMLGLPYVFANSLPKFIKYFDDFRQKISQKINVLAQKLAATAKTNPADAAKIRASAAQIFGNVKGEITRISQLFDVLPPLIKTFIDSIKLPADIQKMIPQRMVNLSEEFYKKYPKGFDDPTTVYEYIKILGEDGNLSPFDLTKFAAIERELIVLAIEKYIFNHFKDEKGAMTRKKTVAGLLGPEKTNEFKTILAKINELNNAEKPQGAVAGPAKKSKAELLADLLAGQKVEIIPGPEKTFFEEQGAAIS